MMKMKVLKLHTSVKLIIPSCAFATLNILNCFNIVKLIMKQYNYFAWLTLYRYCNSPLYFPKYLRLTVFILYSRLRKLNKTFLVKKV